MRAHSRGLGGSTLRNIQKSVKDMELLLGAIQDDADLQPQCVCCWRCVHRQLARQVAPMVPDAAVVPGKLVLHMFLVHMFLLP
jgi:hypothetical protein